MKYSFSTIILTHLSFFLRATPQYSASLEDLRASSSPDARLEYVCRNWNPYTQWRRIAYPPWRWIPKEMSSQHSWLFLLVISSCVVNMVSDGVELCLQGIAIGLCLSLIGQSYANLRVAQKKCDFLQNICVIDVCLGKNGMMVYCQNL